MTFDIRTYGAAADGTTLCTAAIQRAIDACAAQGGGTVNVPAGVYVTGTLFMKSRVELHLENGAVLQASTDLNDYNDEDAYPENFRSDQEQWNGKHLIIFDRCEDAALTGGGWLDGRGDFFFEDVPPVTRYYGWFDGFAKARDKENLRPGQLVTFIRCKNIRLTDVGARNATCWAFFFHGCEFVTVRGVRVINEPWFANTDGIDIDCCHYVTVSDCLIRTGDDCITFRGDTRHLDGNNDCGFITVTNCVLNCRACAFRVGVGQGPVHDVRVSNIVVESSGSAVCLCCGWANRPSYLENIHFSDLTIRNTSHAWTIGGPGWGHAGSVRHASISNVSAEVWATNYVSADGDCRIEDLTLRDIDICFCNRPGYDEARMRAERGEDMLVFENVHGLRTQDLRVRWAEGERGLWRDVERRVGIEPMA